MSVRAVVLVLALTGGALACREASAPAESPGPAPTTAGQIRPPAALELATLLEDEWGWRLRENPQFATTVGDHRYDDRLALESIQDE